MNNKKEEKWVAFLNCEFWSPEFQFFINKIESYLANSNKNLTSKGSFNTSRNL